MKTVELTPEMVNWKARAQKEEQKSTAQYFWKCCVCGRMIGNDEWTSRGRTESDHICEDCFWTIMKSNKTQEVA